MTVEEKNQAEELFEKQIQCLIDDDRKAQMKLYTEDFRCEFPFAHDRPRLIEGRDSFQEVMDPFWEKARRQGVRVIGARHEFHATAEKGLYLAVFHLEVVWGEKTMQLPFVQLIRVRDNLIAEIREYFDPQARAEF
jgi:ketosteroid isomerase-like protein